MCSNNIITFDYRDYDGEHQFTENLKAGDIFIYKTYDIVSHKEYTFKMIKTDKKHKSCNQCSLMKYFLWWNRMLLLY